MHGCLGGVVNGCSGGGHAWLLWGGMPAWLLQGACVVAGGGMRGCSGGGCAWLLGGCAWLLPGGMHGCSQGGVHGIQRDMEIRSMSGRYASYWNAFLYLRIFAFRAIVNGLFKSESFKYLTIQLIGFPSGNILFPDLTTEIACINRPS